MLNSIFSDINAHLSTLGFSIRVRSRFLAVIIVV